MEHKLILGGEQHLPFARSRIKALRATGMQYGSQRFDMGDALVEVSIKLDQDYIKISGGSCTLAMDSGVVDVLNIAEMNPDTFKPGVMHDTAAGAIYNAPFVLPAAGGDWLLNPSTDSSAQLAGTIKGDKAGKFRGKLPADKSAASFSPRPEISNSTVPATWTQAKHDEALWAKKITAILCPASIFTGKTRLYVQALYGRHMYTKSGDAAKADPINIGLVYGSPPYIKVPSYRAPGDTAEYNAVPIFTSTGVYLDKTTGKHWLLSIDLTGITVHPLIGDACAESMRKFLTVPYPKNLPALDEEALERLEAYILSRSLPDQKNAQHAACTLGMSFYSMGYSWHWNWSGTAADIVVSEQYQQRPDSDKYYAMVSSHYRVTASKQDNFDENGKPLAPTWSAAVTALELNKKWCIERLYWVIAEPDIAGGVLYKTTPRFSEYFECDAAFYAFYTGDALQLCRVTMTLMSVPPDSRDASDQFVNSLTGEVQFVSLGPAPGYLREKNYGGAYWSCVITCGDTSTGSLVTGHATNESKIEMKKTIVAPHADGGFGFADGVWTQAYEYGYPPYQLSEVFESSRKNNGYFVGGVSDIDRLSVHEETLSIATAVVPFNDSEAIYLQAVREKTTTTTGTTEHWINDRHPGCVAYVTYVLPSGGGAGLYFTQYAYLPGGVGTGNSPTYASVNEVAKLTETSVMQLNCKAGIVSLDNFDGIGDLHDPEADEATGLFNVLCGASTRHPIVIASKLNQPIGITTVGTAPVFVGYV